MIDTDIPMTEYDDEQLDDHLEEVQARIVAMEQMSQEGELTAGQAQEYRLLTGREVRVRMEVGRRRYEEKALEALKTATAFHGEHPDVLDLLRVGNPVATVKALYDMSHDDLELLADNGELLALLARKVMKHHQNQEYRKIAERAAERDLRDFEEG